LSAVRREHFFFGAPTLIRTAQSLLAASLSHGRGPWPPGPEALPPDAMSRLLGWSVVVPLLVTMGFVIVRALLRRGARSLPRTETFLALIAGTIALTLLLLVASHSVFDLPYPFGRTGLYLIVLFVLGSAALVRCLEHSRALAAKTASSVVFALLVLAAGRFATEFNTTYFYDWRFDSGTRQLFDMVARWPRQGDGRPVRVAASPWLFGPTLDFYRVARNGHRIVSIVEDWEADPSRYDFFVVSPDELDLARRHATLVYVHPVSGAALLVNPERQSAR
jgi:hypothetical protein